MSLISPLDLGDAEKASHYRDSSLEPEEYIYTAPYGTMDYPQGNSKRTYKGYFKGGLPHGRGTITYANGNFYIGEFRNGKRHGEGKLFSPKGTLIPIPTNNFIFKLRQSA